MLLVDIKAISNKSALKRSIYLALLTIILMLVISTQLPNLHALHFIYIASITFITGYGLLFLRHYCFACRKAWKYVTLGKDCISEHKIERILFETLSISIEIKKYLVDSGCKHCHKYKRKERYIFRFDGRAIKRSKKSRKSSLIKRIVGLQ